MVEGFRTWILRKDDEGKAILGSLNSHRFLWEQEKISAECNHGCEIGFCLRNHKCSCGIYSLKTIKGVMKSYGGGIQGSIENYGTVIEGEFGFRAESCTIKTLYTTDQNLAAELKERYPNVIILLPTAEMVKAERNLERITQGNSNWQEEAKRRQARLNEIALAITIGQQKYPTGPNGEKKRLMKLLKGANKDQIVHFAKEYGSSKEWLERNWLAKAENSRKAKPGDFVFEANDDSKPYVFIGSTRASAQTSMRYMFSYNGVLVRRNNIRRWDEEPEFLEARKQAIEEWQ